MIKNFIIFFLIGGLVLFCIGCANMSMMHTDDLLAFQSNVDSLRTEVKALRDEQKSQGELMRLIRADQQLRFGELNRTVSEIASNLSENQNRLSKIDENTTAFKKNFEAKLQSDSLSNNARKEEAQRLFQICMSDFNAGRFDIAINGFNDLVSHFSDSPLSSEAEYWIAECHYAKRSYGKAEKEYINYIKKYPEGSKLCVSLYKLGLSYSKQKKDKSKKMVWKKALEQCSDSPEIQVIKNELK